MSLFNLDPALDQPLYRQIAQRLGNFDAYGPILLGLNAPINDLSRGCNAQEVYSMAIITAALA